MFGFNSNQKSTVTQSQDEDFVLSFEPYPEMSAPQPAVEWRNGDPEWSGDIWGDEVVEVDPQPGYDDQDYDD